MGATPPLNHEEFMRRFLQSERELQRYVMSFVPNAGDARDIVQNTVVALWKKVDKPIAGLLADLKQRGMLDRTLVVWAGEFGRSSDNGLRGNKVVVGRDHNPDAMSVWPAGGGVKGGRHVGATNELGSKAAEVVHHLKDFHVTLLRLMGLDDNRLTYFHSGRFKQLNQTGGQPIQPLLA
jgi:hypothetical protein